MQTTIFVVDDEQSICAVIQRRLERHGYRVCAFVCAEKALSALDHEQPDVVLLDLCMPDTHGLQVLRAMKDKASQSSIIILTAYGSIQDAVEAMKLGAYDFVIKHINLEPLEQVVRQAVELHKLRSLQVGHQAGRYSLARLLADSRAMKHLKRQISELAQHGRSTVLLQGETGTGKEFIARVLHYNSPRSGGLFKTVNCTALSNTLLDSALFGSDPGAGADAGPRTRGALEQADQGTLCLDEIGDLDLAMQAKLLGVLQARSLCRVGGTQVIAFDCQVIAVTSRNLADMMKRGTFREDLFFRLNVVPVTLPPLRECSEDIIPLAMAALARYAGEFRKEIVDIDQETKHVLQHYSYPGNIRELENIIERAVIFCPGRVLTKGCLPPELHQSNEPVRLAWSRENEKQTVRLELSSDRTPLAGVEFALIQQALQSTNYNKTLAAKRLGITRFALIRKLRKFEGKVEPCVMSIQSYNP